MFSCIFYLLTLVRYFVMKVPLIIIIFLFSKATFAQQAKVPYTKAYVESSKAWIDIDYAGDGIIGHKMDVFLPKKGKGPFPVVMAIYGSAWFSNSAKASVFYDGLGQKLLKAGYAVASINHRSSNDAKWPAQLHDVKAAIRFLRANSSSFLIDTHFVGITGYSSGGHLSSMAGVTSNIKSIKIGNVETDLEGTVGRNLNENSHVNAVVDWFGPTDFLIMDACGSSFAHNDIKSPESNLIGGAIQDNKEKVAIANPISYVHQSIPPFLIIHGNKDELVPHCESEKLYEKMNAVQAKAEMIMVDGGKHGPGVMIDTYYNRMIEFFNRVKKNK